MNPFDRIANRYRTLPEVDLQQGRSIAYSRSMTRRIMELIDANSQGNVHGGVIMRMVGETQLRVDSILSDIWGYGLISIPTL